MITPKQDKQLTRALDWACWILGDSPTKALMIASAIFFLVCSSWILKGDEFDD